MEQLNKLLDKIKESRSLASDNALATALGVKRQTVSNWRQDRTLPDAVQCATIAGLTGEPLARVLGIVGEARAINRAEKAVWRKLATSAAALAVLLVTTLIPGIGTRDAHAYDGSIFRIDAPVVSIMSGARAFLTLWHDVLLWLRCRFGCRPTGPHIEAMAA